MSAPKHTRGPWRIELGRDGVPRAIRGPESAEFRNIINWNGLSSPTRPESVANAHLIAAAPDLLQALELAVQHYDEWASGDLTHDLDESRLPWLEPARAAIAKAKGEGQ